MSVRDIGIDCLAECDEDEEGVERLGHLDEVGELRGGCRHAEVGEEASSGMAGGQQAKAGGEGGGGALEQPAERGEEGARPQLEGGDGEGGQAGALTAGQCVLDITYYTIQFLRLLLHSQAKPRLDISQLTDGKKVFPL